VSRRFWSVAPSIGGHRLLNQEVVKHLEACASLCLNIYWLVVWNIFYFSIYILLYIYYIYIGNNHPNWLIFFRGVETSNQYIHTLENTHLTSEQSLFRKANRQEYIPIHEQTLTRIVKYIYMLIIQAWYIITFIYYISVMSFNSWTSAVVLGVFYNCSDPPQDAVCDLLSASAPRVRQWDPCYLLMSFARCAASIEWYVLYWYIHIIYTLYINIWTLLNTTMYDITYSLFPWCLENRWFLVTCSWILTNAEILHVLCWPTPDSSKAVTL